jgi:hypothetical protein
MPDNTNPYLTVNAPSYAAPMLDWQKMAGGISSGLTGQPQQVNRPPVTPPQGPQGGQPGQPGQPQPNQAQQQMQGLGARLRAMFGGQGGQPGQPMGQPSMQPQPSGMTGGGGPQGWAGGWNVNG